MNMTEGEDIKLRVIQQNGKWHAQVVRLCNGEIYDSYPMDTRAEAVAAAQSLLDNALPEGTAIHALFQGGVASASPPEIVIPALNYPPCA